MSLMEQDHKRHFYCAMKAYTKQAISKISIISIKMGAYLIVCIAPKQNASACYYQETCVLFY